MLIAICSAWRWGGEEKSIFLIEFQEREDCMIIYKQLGTIVHKADGLPNMDLEKLDILCKLT